MIAAVHPLMKVLADGSELCKQQQQQQQAVMQLQLCTAAVIQSIAVVEVTGKEY
jgi:hypothetical protein